MSGEASSRPIIAHCIAVSSSGTSTVQSDRNVPRRSTARVRVAPVGQSQPPNRILAQAARKYVSITVTKTAAMAKPAASDSRRSRSRARPMVGSTPSATRKAIRSWSTLP